MNEIPGAGGSGIRQTSHLSEVKPRAAKPSPSQSAPAPRELLTTARAAREVFDVGLVTFHKMRHEPWMPKPVQLTPRNIRWVRSELEQAVANMPRKQTVEEPELLRGTQGRRRQANQRAAGAGPQQQPAPLAA